MLGQHFQKGNSGKQLAHLTRMQYVYVHYKLAGIELAFVSLRRSSHWDNTASKATRTLTFIIEKTLNIGTMLPLYNNLAHLDTTKRIQSAVYTFAH